MEERPSTPDCSHQASVTLRSSLQRWAMAIREADPQDLVVEVQASGMTVATGHTKMRIETNDDAAWRKLASSARAATAVIPASHALLSTITVPSAALDRLDDVLALDLERSTPLKRADVYAGAKVGARSGATTTVTRVVVKRTSLDAAIAAMRKAGLAIKAIRIDDPAFAMVNLLPIAERQRSTLTRALSTATRCAALAFVVAAAGALLVTGWRLSTDLEASQRDGIALTQALADVRRQIAEEDRALKNVRSARERRIAQPRLVELIDDITKRLPTSSWVSELRVDSRAITMSGYATNASGLVPLLSQMPELSTTEFAAPVTRNSQLGTEQFQIRMLRATGKAAAP